VKAVRTFAFPVHSYQMVVALDGSDHPNDHPAATLDLIDAFLAKDPIILFESEIRSIVERIGAADPGLREDNCYRLWAEFTAGRKT
jgi:hypothetical protein